jgi:arabinose-5-phosphate isomerase
VTDQHLDFVLSARKTLETEAAALTAAASRLGQNFIDAAKEILRADGKVVVTGLGKSGHVGRKISATLASTGTPSVFLHPAEALHGDLGVIQKKDVLLALAFGGETEEVLTVARHAKRLGVCVVAITGKLESSLAKLSDFTIDGSVDREVCPHNLAPTSSTTVAMGLGDALAMALMNARGFSQNDFALLHPSGALGRRLMTVADLMKRAGDELPSVCPTTTFHDVLEAVTKKNYGIVPVLSPSGEIIGVISDGDIRRALLTQGSKALDAQAQAIMTKMPRTISHKALAIEAFRLMEDLKITSLFVIDPSAPGQLQGLIRMHDLLAAKIV